MHTHVKWKISIILIRSTDFYFFSEGGRVQVRRLQEQKIWTALHVSLYCFAVAGGLSIANCELPRRNIFAPPPARSPSKFTSRMVIERALSCVITARQIILQLASRRLQTTRERLIQLSQEREINESVVRKGCEALLQKLTSTRCAPREKRLIPVTSYREMIPAKVLGINDEENYSSVNPPVMLVSNDDLLSHVTTFYDSSQIAEQSVALTKLFFPTCAVYLGSFCARCNSCKSSFRIFPSVRVFVNYGFHGDSRCEIISPFSALFRRAGAVALATRERTFNSDNS